MFMCWGDRESVSDAATSIDTDLSFHSEVPLSPIHLGISLPVLLFVEVGTLMMLPSKSVPSFESTPDSVNH